MKTKIFLTVLLLVGNAFASVRGVRVPKSHFYIDGNAEVTFFEGYYFCGIKGDQFAFSSDEDGSYFVKDQQGNVATYKNINKTLPPSYYIIGEKVTGLSSFPKYVFELNEQYEAYILLKNTLNEKGTMVKLRYNSSLTTEVINTPWKLESWKSYCTAR